jgi:hypothetical protein
MDAAHRDGVAVPRGGVGPTPASWFARWVGVGYASAGLVGFGVTGVADPMNTTGHALGILSINPLHNVLHLLVGLALIAGSGLSPGAARVLTLLTAASFGAVGLFGLAVTGTDGNVLALNPADNGLHLVTAAVATGCAIGSSRMHEGHR